MPIYDDKVWEHPERAMRAHGVAMAYLQSSNLSRARGGPLTPGEVSERRRRVRS